MKTNTRIWTVLIALIVVFTAAFGILVIGGEAAQAKSNGGLNVVKNFNVGNEVSEVWGLNTQSHTWKMATITGAGTDSITATFPVNFTVNRIVIMTDNSSQSVYNLLTKSAYYEYTDLTSVDGKITNLYQYFGEYVNDSGTTSVSDKGVTGYALNFTLYGPSTDLFGHNPAVNLLQLFASPWSGTAQYQMNVNSTVNKTTEFSFTFTQYFEASVSFNLVDLVSYFMLAFLLLATVFLWYSTPEHYGDEEDRAAREQARHELPIAIILGAIGLFIYAVVGEMGNVSPLFGYGGATMGLLVGGLFAFGYTAVPTRQKYHYTGFVFVIGEVAGIFLNIVVPDGSIYANYAASTNVLGSLLGWYVVLFGLFLTIVGVINTKRYKLRPRQRKE
ncbi:MAG: hypothetical protein KIS29_09845 [Thermoplasmata archaeon]|nr:hypothetical protein [Candidatus Sysuiplasma jiujiangense]